MKGGLSNSVYLRWNNGFDHKGKFKLSENIGPVMWVRLSSVTAQLSELHNTIVRAVTRCAFAHFYFPWILWHSVTHSAWFHAGKSPKQQQQQQLYCHPLSLPLSAHLVVLLRLMSCYVSSQLERPLSSPCLCCLYVSKLSMFWYKLLLLVSAPFCFSWSRWDSASFLHCDSHLATCSPVAAWGSFACAVCVWGWMDVLPARWLWPIFCNCFYRKLCCAEIRRLWTSFTSFSHSRKHSRGLSKERFLTNGFFLWGFYRLRLDLEAVKCR